MNFFKRIWCRLYQLAFRIISPLLPYREPQLLNNNKHLAEKIKQEGVESVLIVTTASMIKYGLVNSLQLELEKMGIKWHIYSETVPNPTTNNVVAALEIYNSNKCQAIIAFGGGSAMDCAKAVGAKVVKPKKSLKQMKGLLKVNKKLPPLFAIPTTAGTGSETTVAAVITDAETRHKYAINDFNLIPHYALLDATLTLTLPSNITSTTGMDALTHAIEAYIGQSATKKTKKYALEAVKMIIENIEKAYNNGNDIMARENMLKASYLAGMAFTRSYVGYVHAVSHSLSGKYNTAHGLANAVLLPVVLKKYGKKVYKKLWELGVYANLFKKDVTIADGAEIFIKKLEQMNENMNIPTRLTEIKALDVPELAKTAEKEANPLYPVPVLYSAEELEDIYHSVMK